MHEELVYVESWVICNHLLALEIQSDGTVAGALHEQTQKTVGRKLVAFAASCSVLRRIDHQNVSIPFRFALEIFAFPNGGVFAAVGSKAEGIGLIRPIEGEAARYGYVVFTIVDRDRPSFDHWLAAEIASGWN